MDLSPTIIGKTNQLNADSFSPGQTMTIKITAVRGCDEPDQPVAIHYEGDDGKPWKPCLSMRRVLVNVWGTDGKSYVGRRLTLYRDDKVMFGGIQVGGIRIANMSGIDRETPVSIMVTRGKRMPYVVKPLRDERLPDLTKPPYAETKPQDQIDLGEATEDQQIAWCEAWRAVAMRHKTPEALMANWTASFEGGIEKLQPNVRERLETWMAARMKKLRDASVIRD